MSYPRKTWQEWALYLGLSCLILTASVLYVRSLLPDEKTIPTDALPEVPVIVLDAGHGGEDGGASGIDGTLEKTLNLQIADTMAQVAKLLGYPVLLTRTDDTLLYDRYGDLSDYTGKKKTYDLRNRLRVTEESGCTVFCSIHMNKFPQSQCSGLQVYYSPHHPNSQKYAALLQSYDRTFLAPDNTREIKKATSDIYLLHRMELPAILVECGFLSNPEECASLQNPSYQLQLSAVLVAALVEGIENT